MAEVHETDNHAFINGINIDIQKRKRQIKSSFEELKDLKSNHRSLLSLVISNSDEISDVTEDIVRCKSKYEHAIQAITSAEKILAKYSRVPNNGLIIYTGIVYTDDGNKDVTIVFEPLKQINTVTSKLLYKFYMKPLTDDLLPPIPSMQEKFLLNNFLVEKKSVYDMDTWKRLGDVKTLFVCENLDINCYRLKNTRTGEVVTKHLNKQQENDESNFRDSKTIYRFWRRDELQILEKTPLLDWLAQVHQDKLFGYKLEFVSDTSEEGSVFYHACGGIGGILGDNVNGWVQSFVVLLVVGLVAYLVTSLCTFFSLLLYQMDK